MFPLVLLVLTLFLGDLLGLSTASPTPGLLTKSQYFGLPPMAQPSCRSACSWCNRIASERIRNLENHCPDCVCSATANGTCPALPATTPICEQDRAIDAKGCPVTKCAARESVLPLIRPCPKYCPGGLLIDPETGVTQCECVCPLERLKPADRTHRCAWNCYGFEFQVLFSPQTGCIECTCGPPLPLAFCSLLTRCPLFCPFGYALAADNCPVCRCRELDHCPKHSCDLDPLACPPGPRRHPISGCVMSPCSCEEDDVTYCPSVGCPKDCGPHEVKPVLSGTCQVGCRCDCRPPSCPQGPAGCLNATKDVYGCPVCDCEPIEEAPQLLPCPTNRSCDISCASGLRQVSLKGNCELCACCPDVLTTCPYLVCDEIATDKNRCPLCSCTGRKPTSSKKADPVEAFNMGQERQAVVEVIDDQVVFSVIKREDQ